MAAPDPDLPPARRFLAGGGEATRLILARDWTDHPLGPPEGWPDALKVALGLILNSPESMILCWGRDELSFFFNERYIPLLGPRIDWAMGAPFRRVWADAWDQAKPIIDDAFAGKPEHFDDLPWTLNDDRGARETWWSFSYSRVPDAAGETAGLFIFTNETTARVLADAAAREGRERLARETARQRQSLQHMPGFVAILSGPDHVFQFVNDAYDAMGGHRPLIGLAIRDAFPEVADQGFFEALDAVYRTGTPARGNDAPVSLGNRAAPFFMNFLFQPTRDDDGAIDGVFMAGYDTTDRVVNERRRDTLLRVDERLRDVADPAALAVAASRVLGEALGAMRVGYGVLDAHAMTIAVEGSWSAAGHADVTGCHRYRDYGMYVDQLIAGDPVAIADVAHDPRTATGRASFAALGIAAHLDVPLLEDGRAVAAMFVHSDRPRVWTEGEIALVRDVAERTRAAVARRQAEEALRTHNIDLERKVTERAMARGRTWQLSPEIIGVANADGFFEQSNPAWQATLGWSEEEVARTPFIDLVHPDDVAATRAAWAGLIDRGEAALRFENRYRTRHGEWRWLSWVAVPDEDKVYCTARDVTDAKAREAELHAAQEALRQSQKMEAIGSLTGGVAHDFNNLLTPIVGALDLLQRRGIGGEREARLIAGAAQSADRAKVLVQRLLAFARRQPLQPVAVDVADLVRNMGDLVRSTTGPQIRVTVEAADALPAARADPNQLEMALLNLAVNARDAMPDGGSLRISATEEEIFEGQAGPAAGRYVRLSVADTGMGMDSATLDRAVEPFFSTKGVGKGTGLGLSMVHGLASQLGGALTIDSRPALGTNVSLWLPRSDAAPGAAPAPAPMPVPTARGTVMLVDDEEAVRASTAAMLADLGYDVVEAVAAEPALAIVHGGAALDLVVTDHLMPGMTGSDLARAIATRRPGLPILVISGYAESEGIEPDLPRLTKPFRQDELAAALGALRRPVAD